MALPATLGSIAFATVAVIVGDAFDLLIGEILLFLLIASGAWARRAPDTRPLDLLLVTRPAWSIARFAAATAALSSSRPMAEPGSEGVDGGHHEAFTSRRVRIDEYDREPTIVRPASTRTLPRQEERS
jgi:hypothetical protein